MNCEQIKSKVLEVKCSKQSTWSVWSQKRNYILKNDTGHEICHLDIDNCTSIQFPSLKCDHVFLVCKGNCIIFVELKGQDVAHGFKQIKSTIETLRKSINLQDKTIHAKVISSKVPNLNNDKTEYKKAYSDLSKLIDSNRIEPKTNQIQDTVSKLISN